MIGEPPLPCLEIVDSAAKGLGVKTTDKICRGRYICEYLGEFIDADEARKRLSNSTSTDDHNYLIMIREHFLPSVGDRVIGIDARKCGNIARFVNHSCDPNTSLIIGHIGSDLPRVGLFAMRDIHAGEEICFDYGSNNSSLSAAPCHCNSSICRLFLPKDDF